MNVKAIQQQLNRMKKFQIEEVYRKTLFRYSKGSKKEMISKLLRPLRMKYKMEKNDTLRRVNKLPEDIEKEIAKFFPNLSSEQAVQRFGMLPEELQRKILDDYSGLRHTSAARIQQFIRDRILGEPERVLDLNVLLDERDSDLYANVWNRDHPQGPWWREFECDICRDFQWFLTYDEDSNQPAYDEDWYSVGDMFVCPECNTNPDVVQHCEGCGEAFVEHDIDDFMYRDEHTEDLYCRDCFRHRYFNDFDNEEDLDRFIETRRLINL